MSPIPAPPAELALKLSGITKRFGALVANDDISLTLARGEVLALLGENGAGKSTLVNILFGHYVADAGSVEVFGQALPPGDPKAALAAGVGMVHQHFTLADNLSVLDNILLGTEPLWWPRSRRAAARAKVLATAQKFGLAVEPDARVGTLSVGERQRVEILKALYRGARILILDEPTAVLTPQESEALFATLSQLVADGLGIVFISHKLDEVLRVSHRIAVLRGGRLVAERAAAGTAKAELAALMVGRRVELPTRPAAGTAPGEPVLSLRQVTVRGPTGQALLDGVSLTVRAGELVAIAGVSGNGQVVLAELLSGLRPAQTGELQVQGRVLRARPRDWVAARVARIPEDRHAEGVIGDLPVWENAVSERLHTPAFSRFGVIRREAARAAAQALVERFDVRLRGLDVATRTLSGGNMQKLVLGRALAVAQTGAGRDAAAPGPVLIVASQPTWGLDIGAVAFVHRCLLEAVAAGAAVLMISEDLDEIFALADRVAVMHHGRLGAAKPCADWTLAEIGLAMAGTTGGPAETPRHAA
ncbi:MAG TPA: ABC transporter ATP-binding protein [Ideonella sp.]|nr:ABC transporter ATP-binding protein [Ideonella sp.]